MSFFLSVNCNEIELTWEGLNPPGLDETKLTGHMRERLPQGRVLSVLDRLKDPELLMEAYPQLKGRARFRERRRSFVLALSTDNLRRLFSELKHLTVISGKEHVTELYRKQGEFSQDLSRAVAIKGKAELPAYDYKVPPLGEYQHRGTVYLANVKAGALFADCGCLSGETIIRTNRAGNGKCYSIEDLYKRAKGITARWVAGIPIRVRSFNEECIALHEIEDVVQSGSKPTWRVTLEDGKSLKATSDHQFLTKRGWVALKELTSDDAIMVDNLKRGYLHFPWGTPEYSPVAKIEFACDEMTYDIVCKEPHHNFVANGMVVHNSGKTFMVLSSTEQQIKKGLLTAGKTLVCVKLATIRHGWLMDTEKFTGLKSVALWAPNGKKRKEKLLALLNEPADLYIINHDGLRVLKDELIAKRFEKVVVDESTILKSYRGPRGKGGVFGKALDEVAQYAAYRVIMSGTPAPNDADDLWGQFKFIDPCGFLLGANFRDFKASFMKELTFGRPGTPGVRSKWVMTKDGRTAVSKIIDPLVFRVKLRDHIKDMPAKHVMSRSLAMTPEQLRHYDELEATLETVIDDETISVTVMLAMLQKLRQITGGFIIDKDGEPHVVPQNPKMAMLDTLLDDEIHPSEKVVIFAQYRWEIEQIKARYKHYGVGTVYGGNSGAQNLAAIDQFLTNKAVRIIVLHPRSAAHGITLTNACYMVFYSFGYSNEEDYQAVKRIERASQTREMRVYYLLCQDSIDEVMFDTITAKALGQAQLIDGEVGTDVDLVWKKLRGALASKRTKRAKKRAS